MAAKHGSAGGVYLSLTVSFTSCRVGDHCSDGEVSGVCYLLHLFPGIKEKGVTFYIVPPVGGCCPGGGKEMM